MSSSSTRKKGGNSVLIIRFANRKNKNALLKQGNKLKGTNVYVNEHLTKECRHCQNSSHVKKTKENSSYVDSELQSVY